MLIIPASQALINVKLRYFEMVTMRFIMRISCTDVKMKTNYEAEKTRLKY